MTEDVQNGKIDLVGAMRISRMNFGLDIGRVIVEQIENIMAFMLIGSEDSGIDGNVVGGQGIGRQSFLQSKIFGGMPGAQRMNPGFKFLSVTAGVDGFIDVVMPENT